MDPIIVKTIQRTDELRKELARAEAFLAYYYEMSGQEAPAKTALSDAEKADAPKARTSRPRVGLGAETLEVAERLVRERGPMSTRELLPLIQATGIEVGGNDPVATLSARLSGKGDLETVHGKWRFKQAETALEKETADNPITDKSAASLDL